MYGNKDPGAWRIEDDHEKIRQLAALHEIAPITGESADRDVPVDLEPRTNVSTDEEITWDEFFDTFEDDELLVRYRPMGAERESTLEVEVVNRAVSEDEERHDHLEADEPATSDTGDAEPVSVSEMPEEDTGTTDTERPPERETPSTASTAPVGDTERGPTEAADGLVLDEVHPAKAGRGGPDDEYVTFENEGDRPIDLSGWRVHNETGATYEFPPGVVLDPGDRVTVYSGDGADSDGHQYWEVDESIWDVTGDVVIVETAAGERVLREPFEA